jgi:hypothetical protein
MMQEFLDDWLAKSLDEAILTEFPAPIAIAYRRFKAARFNNYERLDRLITLVESCVYFVFHTLMADYTHNKWFLEIPLSNDARQALKGDDSIDHRLKFIDEVTNAARAGKVSLFMPELDRVSVVSVGDLIREKVRNPTAHHAPGAEQRVRLVIEEHLPQAEKLLDELRFLSEYTLCQIKSHSHHKGQWFYQAVTYKGAEYDVSIDEEPLEFAEGEAPRLIEAERDHLVLLDSSYGTLDVFPFYQVQLGPETGHEPHLCFYKRCRHGTKELLGESVRSGIEVMLQGYDEFRSMTR